MSISHSIGADSTSSSTTMSINHSNEQQLDPSNILYNDHQNYQTIFTNDSRFFDTSLHLYKSYCKLGYIQSDKKKAKKHRFPTTTTTHVHRSQSNGNYDYGRSKQAGFSSNHQINGHNDGTLKPQISRNNGEHFVSQRSNSNPSKLTAPKLKHENARGATVSHHQQRPSPNHSNLNDDDDDNFSDDSDIIVTRL